MNTTKLTREEALRRWSASKETKVYFSPFFITFYLLVVFRGTKIMNLSETA